MICVSNNRNNSSTNGVDSSHHSQNSHSNNSNSVYMLKHVPKPTPVVQTPALNLHAFSRLRESCAAQGGAGDVCPADCRKCSVDPCLGAGMPESFGMWR